MELPDAIDEIRPSIVQIAVRLDPGKIPHTVGTGFIVDERSTVVTAWHVIEGGAQMARAAGITGPPQFVANLAHQQVFEAGGHVYGMQGFSHVDLDLLVAVPGHDLAGARLAENVVAGEWDERLVPIVEGVKLPPLAGLATLDTKTPREGAAVAVSGYPFAVESLVTNSGTIATAFFPSFPGGPMPDPPRPPADTPGEVRTQEILTPGPASNRYLADLEVNPGNSGGPVYLVDTAEVIGVCVATRQAPVYLGNQPASFNGAPLTYSSGLTVVIPAPYVEAMLRDERVTAETLAMAG